MHAATGTVPNTYTLVPPTTRSPVLECWMMGVTLACLSPHARDVDFRVSPASHYPRRLIPLHPTNSALFTFILHHALILAHHRPSSSLAALPIIATSTAILTWLFWRRSLSSLPHPCHPLAFVLSHPPPPLCHHRISLKAHRTMVSINPKP